MAAGEPRGEQAEPVRTYVALGANLGDAQTAVRLAMDALDRLPQSRVVRRSSLYRTSPVARDRAGPADGPDYINAVVAMDTRLLALDLLDQLQALEQAAGRERSYPDAPRTLDLDILLYGDARIASPRLSVPHPRMAQRAFVLVPLVEIAPKLVSAAQLAAVAEQTIQRLPEVSLPM
ncbi:MAG: 2-amino-4-hydroxy-6-hydroxymethyldihydropteridine diphosphokinase [Polaromonas sp.]|nr:2-amino-4-hydroxy-6-hydroxymethyldihydropteridine diphosphokinase [Polaromonas sp.]